MRRFNFLLLCSFCLLMAFANPSYASLSSYTFNVNVTSDTVDASIGDSVCQDAAGNCSLRAAIMQANALTPANVTINVPAGTYNLTITSGAEEDASASNDLDVNNSGSTLTITGAGTGQDVVINALAIAHRVFHVLGGANLTLNNLTITGGDSSVAGGGIRVESGATLNLHKVIITGNASVNGGGIYNAGTITGNLVSITSNTASEMGAGLYTSGANSVNFYRSLFAENTSTSWGGGIFNTGTNLHLENVTVGGNTSTDNSTHGAGIFFQSGSATYLLNCTIANNNTPSSSGSGVGLFGNGGFSGSIVNTLVVNNRNADGVNNCYQVGSSNYNMSDDSSCGSFTTTSSILLASSLTTSATLAGVGTYKLQTGSAAIDAGDPANFAALDVFGTTRPVGSNPDIGAYEFTNDNEPPTKPVLTNPASGYIVFGNGLTLYWEKSTDPEGGKVTYRLQIADDAGFTTNVQTFIVDENGSLLPAVMLPFLVFFGWGIRRKKNSLMLMAVGVLLTATLFIGCSSDGWNAVGTGDEDSVSFEVTGLENGKTYYWRVIAVDENDAESEPSETRSFVIN